MDKTLKEKTPNGTKRRMGKKPAWAKRQKRKNVD